MLLCHFLETHVGANYNTAEVRGKSSQSIDGSFEVFFMATEIDKGNDFVALGNYLPPILVLILVKSFRNDLLPFFGEAHDLLPNRTSSA